MLLNDAAPIAAIHAHSSVELSAQSARAPPRSPRTVHPKGVAPTSIAAAAAATAELRGAAGAAGENGEAAIQPAERQAAEGPPRQSGPTLQQEGGQQGRDDAPAPGLCGPV